MKRFVAILCLLFVFGSASTVQDEKEKYEVVLDQVAEQFHSGLSAFENMMGDYILGANFLDSTEITVDRLKNTHLQVRRHFKSIELFLEYFDHYSIKKMINGAPLLTVEPKVAEVVTVEPCGLQVLDELIFGEEVFGEKEAIVKLVNKLVGDFRSIRKYQKKIKITHRHVFEAVREELVRIFTLGVTGFDTPGSGHAIPEAVTALKACAQVLSPYYELAGEQEELVAEIEQLFENGLGFLKKAEGFDSFDRLHFLKNHVDPLYAKVYELQLALGIETIGETTDRIQAVNYSAKRIFDPAFLNPGFYSNIDFTDKAIQKRVELGKTLFYDPILSANNQMACSSCHQPEKAFTDGLAKSRAINGKDHIKRNAPTLLNSVYSERYFYDLREPSLERQIKHVVLDSMEFSTDFFEIIDKLQQSNEYKALFKEAYAAYPDYRLSKWSISDALACFVSSLRSFNSPVDRYIRGETTALDPSVKRGFNLFMGKAACGTCHFAPTFNGTVPPDYDESESEVLGVPASRDTIDPALDPDLGRFGSSRPIDQADFYIASFKTPTIRNIAQTGPYMHNGVYLTLEEVVDFYDKGGGIGLGLKVPYQTLPDVPLHLNEQEKADLIAFMEALTDQTIDVSKPDRLPVFEEQSEWNKRLIGGKY